MKIIARILHLPSVVQSEFYEATRIHFVHKEKNFFLQQFISLSLLVSVAPFWKLCIARKQRRIRILVLRRIQKSSRCLRSKSKMALHWRGETERRVIVVKKVVIKVVIFIFFVYKKYSRRFIKFRLNHWRQMEYSGDAFYSFLNLDSVSFLLHLFLSDPADPVSISLTNGHVLTLQFLYCISFGYFLNLFFGSFYL